ncbi:GerMN domain-containing protein [Paenibacillus eucommiae]|uniref:Germination protein M n=1 Tax=Paenibacillus eucommiae TaxID=1355755 RepID=A0ABS4J7T1_9BACL|nr:GerMN domain-containing protein [Paenibacillus eucommiae]MBP1995907.1 germination protein M [Paenibacillus eucommiae]
MLQRSWFRTAAIAGVIVLMTTGCSLFGAGEKNQIDPPQAEAGAGGEAELQTTSGTAVVETSENLTPMTVFVKDAKGFVTPVSLDLPKTPSVARTTLEYMVKDGPVSNMLPAGFEALLPQGTVVKGIDIKAENKLAIVDFSKEFANYEAQDERKILEGVTWALTSFPTVEKVQIRVNGTDLTEMPIGKTPLDEPLSRMMGINIEKSEDAEFGQSTPVTLYFLNQNDQDYKYYVPVTRMVKRTDDVVAAVLDQLIKGPDPKKGLSAVINGDTQVQNVKTSENLVTVNFSENLLNQDSKASSDALQSVILSLTENTGIGKVQIMVDGAVQVTSTDGEQNYSNPVSRPVHINPAKL